MTADGQEEMSFRQAVTMNGPKNEAGRVVILSCALEVTPVKSECINL